MAAKIFSLLAIHGMEFFESLVDRQMKIATEFAQKIESLPDFELAVAPQANIVCFRYAPSDVPLSDLSELNARVRRCLTTEGCHYIVQTTPSRATLAAMHIRQPVHHRIWTCETC